MNDFPCGEKGERVPGGLAGIGVAALGDATQEPREGLLHVVRRLRFDICEGVVDS